MDYLAGLNDEQRDAVLACDGPVSVLAGAGAGKTRVLTTRIYHLIRQGVSPESILAVTFTNKAAREMRERLSRRLGQELTAWKRDAVPFIATFHGLGRELLECYGSVLNIPRHFVIYDRDDSERAVKQALKDMGLDPKEHPPRAIMARISREKGEGNDAAAFAERSRNDYRARIASDVWTRYQAVLASAKALDFDDLIALPVKLLAEHPEVRAQVQERFTYVHVDEYQDTSVLQGKLIDLLAGERQNVFVVGDIDQCIYTWRNATIDNLLSFEETYPSAKTIVLSRNYRSSKTIVDTANRVIEKNKNRKEKVSVTDNPEGEPITVYIAGSAEDEARYVAEEARRLIQDGIAAPDIAVLYRTNFQSRALEEAFLNAQVPYKLLGTHFYDRKEVKDVLAWVRLALDPSRAADYVRAVAFPSRGIGKVTLGKLVAGKRDELRPGDRAKVEGFERIVRKLSEAALTAAPSVFLRMVIEESGMREAYEKGGEDDLERLENAQELATLASRHDDTPGLEGIAAFLAEAALAGDQDEMDRKEGREGVMLMTVHAAKGLEFDTVFVTGLEEGLFPHEGMDEEERDEEEERRLFYVAVTRAKRKLHLTLARIRRIYGADFMSEPSSFLDDVDASVVQYEQEQVPTIE